MSQKGLVRPNGCQIEFGMTGILVQKYGSVAFILWLDQRIHGGALQSRPERLLEAACQKLLQAFAFGLVEHDFGVAGFFD